MADYTFLPMGFSSHYHIHPVYHMVFVLDGQGILQLSRSETFLAAKNVVIINPMEKHIFSTSSFHLNYFTINFYLIPIHSDENTDELMSKDQSYIERLAETEALESIFDIETENSLVKYNVEYQKAIEQDIVSFKNSIQGNAFRLFLDNKNTHFNYVNRHVDFLTSVISRYFSDNNFVGGTSPCLDILVWKIMQYIKGNINCKLDLKHLSEFLGYNSSYLSSHFSKKMNMTISEYHSVTRLSKACEYLKNSGMSITDIANTLGYSSAQHFSSVFKQYKKVMPREYRNNIELY